MKLCWSLKSRFAAQLTPERVPTEREENPPTVSVSVSARKPEILWSNPASSKRASKRKVSICTSVSSTVLFSLPSKSESESNSVSRVLVPYFALKLMGPSSTLFKPILSERLSVPSSSPSRPEISKPSVLNRLPLRDSAASPRGITALT